MPLPKGSRDGPVGTTGKEKNTAGAGEAGSSDLRSGSSEGTKKRKTLVLGPNHNTTGESDPTLHGFRKKVFAS